MACPKPVTRKKAFETGQEGTSAQDRIERLPPEEALNYRGIAGDPLDEYVPKFFETKSEKVISGANNTWIVLGRDRPFGRSSGYINNTQAGAIDIVVGRMASSLRHLAKLPKPRPKFHSSPSDDAARIYISQKTDVDNNFDLVDGKVGNAETKSAIAIKADGVRIIAREGIKLVTRTDPCNSQGGEIAAAVGIDLIATNNDEDLQPIVKGYNLVDCLSKMVVHINKLNGVVDAYIQYQSKFNEAITHHTHKSPMQLIYPKIGPGFTWETWPSGPVQTAGIKALVDELSQCKRSLMTHKTNLGTFQAKYLMPGATGKYINSEYNNTT